MREQAHRVSGEAAPPRDRHDPVSDADHTGLRSHEQDCDAPRLVRAGIRDRQRNAFARLGSPPLPLDECEPEFRREDRRDSGASRDTGVGARLPDAVEVAFLPTAKTNDLVVQFRVGVAKRHQKNLRKRPPAPAIDSPRPRTAPSGLWPVLRGAVTMGAQQADVIPLSP